MSEIGKGKKTGLTNRLVEYLRTLPGQQCTAAVLKAAFPEFMSKQINDALRKSSLVEATEYGYRNPMWRLKTATAPVNEKLRQDIREWLQKMVPQTKGAIQARFRDRATRLEIAEIIYGDPYIEMIDYDGEQSFTLDAKKCVPPSSLPSATDAVHIDRLEWESIPPDASDIAKEVLGDPMSDSSVENSAISSDVPNRRHPLWKAFDLALVRLDSESFQAQSAGWRRLADVFGSGYLAGRACQLVEVYAHGGGEKNILDAIIWVSLNICYGRLKTQAPNFGVLDTFDLAVDQCTKGKGVRHGGDKTPFYTQKWPHLATVHGTGFLTGQAQKNFEESFTKEGEARERGQVETLVWLAMAVLKGRGYPEASNG